jgi:hypothetical protein
LGKDEVATVCVFARRAAALVVTPGLGRRPADSSLGGGSSGGVRLIDTRPRVLPLDSGVAVLIVAWDGDLRSPIDARGVAGLV